MPLELKGQGFPEVLNKLGVNPPIRGPFWGFEPTVIPTFELGNASNAKVITDFEYIAGNWQDGVFVNPGAAVLMTSPALERGLYAIWFHWTFGNGVAATSDILFKVRNAAASVMRTTAVDVIGGTGSSHDFGRGEMVRIEPMEEGWDYILENLTALAAATIRLSTKFLRLGDIRYEINP